MTTNQTEILMNEFVGNDNVIQRCIGFTEVEGTYMMAQLHLDRRLKYFQTGVDLIHTLETYDGSDENVLKYLRHETDEIIHPLPQNAQVIKTIRALYIGLNDLLGADREEIGDGEEFSTYVARLCATGALESDDSTVVFEKDQKAHTKRVVLVSKANSTVSESGNIITEFEHTCIAHMKDGVLQGVFVPPATNEIMTKYLEGDDSVYGTNFIQSDTDSKNVLTVDLPEDTDFYVKVVLKLSVGMVIGSEITRNESVSITKFTFE